MATKDVKFTHYGARDIRGEDGRVEQFYLTNMQATLGCCGAVLAHACRLNAPHEEMAESKLRQWLDNRVKRHRCELVSEENPMGLLPPNGMRAKAEVV